MKAVVFILLILVSSFSLLAQEGDSADVEGSYYDDGTLLDSLKGAFTVDSTYSDYVQVSPDSTESTKSYIQEDITRREFDEEAWKRIVGDTDYTEEKHKEKKKDPKKEGWKPVPK